MLFLCFISSTLRSSDATKPKPKKCIAHMRRIFYPTQLVYTLLYILPRYEKSFPVWSNKDKLLTNYLRLKVCISVKILMYVTGLGLIKRYTVHTGYWYIVKNYARYPGLHIPCKKTTTKTRYTGKPENQDRNLVHITEKTA